MAKVMCLNNELIKKVQKRIIGSLNLRKRKTSLTISELFETIKIAL